MVFQPQRGGSEAGHARTPCLKLVRRDITSWNDPDQDSSTRFLRSTRSWDVGHTIWPELRGIMKSSPGAAYVTLLDGLGDGMRIS